jgi:hypothetical protein
MPPVEIGQDPKILAWAHQTYIDEPSTITEDLPPFVAATLVETCREFVPSRQPPPQDSEIVNFEMPFRITFGCDEDGEYVRLIRDVGVACFYEKTTELRMPLKELPNDEGNTGEGPKNVYLHTLWLQITYLYSYSPKTGMKPVSLPEYLLLQELYYCRTTINTYFTESERAKEMRKNIRHDWSKTSPVFQWRILDLNKRKQTKSCSPEDAEAIKKMRNWQWPEDPVFTNRYRDGEFSRRYLEKYTAKRAVVSPKEGVKAVVSPKEGHSSRARLTEEDDFEIDWRDREKFVECILIYRTQESDLVVSNCRKTSPEKEYLVSIAKKLKTRITTRAEKVYTVTDTDYGYGSAVRGGRERKTSKARKVGENTELLSTGKKDSIGLNLYGRERSLRRSVL